MRYTAYNNNQGAWIEGKAETDRNPNPDPYNINLCMCLHAVIWIYKPGGKFTSYSGK